MRKVLCLLVPLLLASFVLTSFAEKEIGSNAANVPIKVAKEYVAKKYDCDIRDLTHGEVLVGRGGAHIDITHGYETERVYLIRKDLGDDWKVEDSHPRHEY